MKLPYAVKLLLPVLPKVFELISFQIRQVKYFESLKIKSMYVETNWVL